METSGCVSRERLARIERSRLSRDISSKETRLLRKRARVLRIKKMRLRIKPKQRESSKTRSKSFALL